MMMRQVTIKQQVNRIDLKQAHLIGVESMTGEAEKETETET